MHRHAVLVCGLLACSPRPAPSTTRREPAQPAPLQSVLDDFRGDPHGDLKGVIVVVDGHVAGEAYYNGDGPETLHDIRSAGKSITSLLVGIAIDRGAIRDVDQPMADLLAAPGLAGITLRHVLTMSTGLAADDRDPSSPGNEDRMDEA